MRNIARRWRTVLLGLPVMGALAFGASQALAAPGAAVSERTDCPTEPRCWVDCPWGGGYEVVENLPCYCCPY
jgi:hypothetical protein